MLRLGKKKNETDVSAMPPSRLQNMAKTDPVFVFYTTVTFKTQKYDFSESYQLFCLRAFTLSPLEKLKVNGLSNMSSEYLV